MVRKLRNYFFRGIAALLPMILTIWLFVQVYQFIQKSLSNYVNYFIVNIILWFGNSSPKEDLVAFWVNGKGQIAGFVIVLLLVCVIGAAVASVLGRSAVRSIEKMLLNVPFVSRVYPYIKQVTDALFNKENNLAFKGVVAIEYPRVGIWSIGFVTGSGLRQVGNTIDEPIVAIFIPSSPTPFTGYVIMTRESETITLNLTIEEALRFTVSGGVITPSQWQDLHPDAKPTE